MDIEQPQANSYGQFESAHWVAQVGHFSPLVLPVSLLLALYHPDGQKAIVVLDHPLPTPLKLLFI
jgi:hypothetical protein